jgi:hypothetical protein
MKDYMVGLCMVREEEGVPLPTNHASLSLGVKCPRMLKTDQECICSSGNVRVGRLSYRSLVMEYGETCIPGRMADLCKILTVIDVKLFMYVVSNEKS